MGLFGGAKKTAMYHIDGLPTGFKYVVNLSMDLDRRMLNIKMPDKLSVDIPLQNIKYARLETIIDKIRDIKGTGLKIGYISSKTNEDKEIVLLHSAMISNGYLGFIKQLQKNISSSDNIEL